MTAPRDTIGVRIDGHAIDGVQSIEIGRDIEQACSTCVVSVYRPREKNKALALYDQSLIEVLRGRTPVFTGWIETPQGSIDAGDVSTTLQARSLTCDIVDCCMIGRQPRYTWRRAPLSDLIEYAAGIWGLGVAWQSPDMRRLTIVRAIYDHTQKAHEFLVEACKQLGLMLCDTMRGEIAIMRAGAAQATDTIMLGSDVMTKISASQNSGQRFSPIIMEMSQANPAGGDIPITWEVARATDDTVSRYRPLVLRAEAPGDRKQARARAEWEMQVRAGRTLTVPVDVDSWAQRSGELWDVGMSVTVGASELFSEPITTIIRSASYRLDASGETCALQLCDPRAYTPEPKRRILTGGLDGLINAANRSQR